MPNLTLPRLGLSPSLRTNSGQDPAELKLTTTEHDPRADEASGALALETTKDPQRGTDARRTFAERDHRARAQLESRALPPRHPSTPPLTQVSKPTTASTSTASMTPAEAAIAIATAGLFAPTLPPETKSTLVEQLRAHATDMQRIKLLSTVAHSDGFAALSPRDQQQLLRLLGGDSEMYSKSARQALGDIDVFRGLDAGAQTAKLRALFTPGFGMVPSATGLVENPYTVSPPTAGANWFPASGMAPSQNYVVTVTPADGSPPFTVPVSVADGVREGTDIINDVFRAIATLPPAIARQLPGVRLSNWSWGSKAQTGSDGVVDYNPQVGRYTSATSTLLHEAGHSLQNRQMVPDWNDAVAADGALTPSGYGKQGTGENFAEMMVLYYASKARADGDQIRALFPQQFAAIDALLQRLH